VTPRQIEVARNVLRAWMRDGAHYRAEGSGERVTLASLYRAGALDRLAWRGEEGAADAAHEYRPSPGLLAALAEADG